MLQCGLAISITALTVLGMAITAVAAPYTPKSGHAIALARRSARLNIRASEALRAKIASHITISAKLLVGVAVLSRPTPPTTAKPPRRVVLARGYLQVGIGDPKLSILFAWKMQYALTLTVVPFEFHLPPIVILGWDGH